MASAREHIHSVFSNNIGGGENPLCVRGQTRESAEIFQLRALAFFRLVCSVSLAAMSLVNAASKST